MAELGVGDIALIALLGAVLFVPGLVIGLLAGLPRWTALAVAPLITYGVTAVAGPATAALGVSWGPVALLSATVLVAAAVLLVRRRWTARRARRAQPATADSLAAAVRLPQPSTRRRRQLGELRA